MKIIPGLTMLVAVGLLNSCASSPREPMGNLQHPLDMASFYLPNAEAARVVTVTTNGVSRASIVVQTQAVAVKENAAKESLEKFGEVYAFSPAFFAVQRDEPTQIRFWNLQPDDNHDFMLIDPHGKVLLSQLLPPLKETSYIFTFHEEGLFNLVCAMHQPAMSAQVLVLPPPAALP